MQEVLSRTKDTQVPLKEQEYYELRLDDIVSTTGTRFRFGEAHASWSEIDRQMMWDSMPNEEFATLEDARRRYDERRAALAKRGYIYSDMDF
jgi:hypothetical protein